MAEFERVPLRPRPDRDWLPTVGLVFTVFVALAILKPWGASRPSAAGEATAPATFFIRPTERSGPPGYNPILFGPREPDPAWELWPAGYVVQFGLAGPVKVTGQEGASPAPGGSPMPGTTPSRSGEPPSPPVTTPPRTTPPVDRDLVDVGPADHLVALGINTPLDARVASVELLRVDGPGAPVRVPIVRLPTLWESAHFIVIAPEDPEEPGQPAPWEAGLYRLGLTTVYGDLRVVDLEVRPPLS